MTSSAPVCMCLKVLFLDFKTVPDLASHLPDFVFCSFHPIHFPVLGFFLSSFSALLWIILPYVLHILSSKQMWLVTLIWKPELVKTGVMLLKKLQNFDIFLTVSLKISISALNTLSVQYVSNSVYWIYIHRYINLSGFVMQKYMNKQVPNNQKEELYLRREQKCPLRLAGTLIVP